MDLPRQRVVDDGLAEDLSLEPSLERRDLEAALGGDPARHDGNDLLPRASEPLASSERSSALVNTPCPSRSSAEVPSWAAVMITISGKRSGR